MKNGWLQIQKQGLRESLISFFLCSLISLFFFNVPVFSIYLLIELTEIFVCICNQIFLFTQLTFLLRSLFTVICWLLVKVHIGRGLY